MVVTRSCKLSITCNACLILVLALMATPGDAAVLSEDRADVLYHRYDGGGVTVQGPALLIRKDLKEKLSFSLSYYHDSISGASPDVFIAGASEYSESRDELGAGVDYLYGNTLMNLSYAYSTENDFMANTVSLGVSHELFGGLTTFSMGFARGFDTIERSDNDLFKEQADRFNYQLGLTQVLTPTLLMSASYEGIADEGFLNNPYRRVLIQGSNSEFEKYPRTRTSNAVGVKALKYWPHRASSHLSYRFYTDTWDITGHTAELGYSQYFASRWLADVYYRYYTQNGASFYSNNFDQELNFMARDKELSPFTSNTLGAKVSYELFDQYRWFNDATVNLALEWLYFDYDEYTKVNPAVDPNADNYSFSAYTLQAFFSMRY